MQPRPRVMRDSSWVNETAAASLLVWREPVGTRAFDTKCLHDFELAPTLEQLG